MEFRLIPDEDREVIVPLLQTLNPSIPEALLKQRLAEMVHQGYACAGAYVDGKLVGCCGMWILTKIYVGKHIEPDNVVILPEYRSQGAGKKMMEWVYEYGKANGCVASELNCYTANAAGQKFWVNEGYAITGFHYQKKFV